MTYCQEITYYCLCEDRMKEHNEKRKKEKLTEEQRQKEQERRSKLVYDQIEIEKQKVKNLISQLKLKKLRDVIPICKQKN